MIIFPTGITITETEHKCLLHVEANPEQWLRDVILEKARLRRDALINEWRPRLFADPNVDTLPADADALVQLIIAHPDYKSRTQADAENDPPEAPYRHNVERFETQVRTGATITLFPTGIDLPNADCNCILAYIQDLDDWILGALLGHINRGKKKMIAQYQPVLLADLNVATLPADEDGLIKVITARADYKTLPEQAEAFRLAQIQTGRNLA